MNATLKKEGEKLTYKHCSKEGHDEDHCWKLHHETRTKKFNNKGKQNIATTTQQDLGSNSGDETKIITMGMKGIASNASIISSSKHIESQNDKERSENFHIRVITKHTKVDTLFNSGSQVNLISEAIVKKLNLETTPHTKPYPLGWEPEGFPPKIGIQHEIHLQQDAQLPNIGMYRMSFLENAKVKKQIQELLEKWIIKPSTSPSGSRIVLVQKKDGTWRICVDFKALNKITVKNRYPLPHIDNLLNRLKEVVYFTKLDLRSGYH
eukprot:PITA_13359